MEKQSNVRIGFWKRFLAGLIDAGSIFIIFLIINIVVSALNPEVWENVSSVSNRNNKRNINNFIGDMIPRSKRADFQLEIGKIAISKKITSMEKFSNQESELLSNEMIMLVEDYSNKELGAKEKEKFRKDLKTFIKNAHIVELLGDFFTSTLENELESSFKVLLDENIMESHNKRFIKAFAKDVLINLFAEKEYIFSEMSFSEKQINIIENTFLQSFSEFNKNFLKNYIENKEDTEEYKFIKKITNYSNIKLTNLSDEVLQKIIAGYVSIFENIHSKSIRTNSIKFIKSSKSLAFFENLYISRNISKFFLVVFVITLSALIYFLIEGITRLSLGKLFLRIRIGKGDGSKGSLKLFLLRFCLKCSGFIIALIGTIISADAVIVTGYIVNMLIFIGFLWSLGSYKASIYDLILGSAVFKLTEIEVRLAKNNIFKVCILVIGSIIIIPLIAIILFITYQGGSAVINWLSPLLFVKIIILLCSIVGIIIANKLIKTKKIRIIVSLISSIALVIMFAMIVNWDFIATPKQLRDYGGGGIGHSLIGTIILIVIAVIVSVPLGIGAGIFLAEKPKSKIASIVRTTVELFQGVPSVIIGLVGYLWLVLVMGRPTAIAGGITLSLMMFPLIIRSTEETLKLVPSSLKEASLALGVPYYKTVLKVILPTGMSGIVTGILLGIGRIAGETAPLLFTIFGNPSISVNLFQPIDALPLLIYNYATGPAKELHSIAWGASFVLMVFILLLNVFTRLAIRKK